MGVLGTKLKSQKRSGGLKQSQTFQTPQEFEIQKLFVKIHFDGIPSGWPSKGAVSQSESCKRGLNPVHVKQAVWAGDPQGALGSGGKSNGSSSLKFRQ